MSDDTLPFLFFGCGVDQYGRNNYEQQYIPDCTSGEGPWVDALSNSLLIPVAELQ